MRHRTHAVCWGIVALAFSLCFPGGQRSAGAGAPDRRQDVQALYAEYDLGFRDGLAYAAAALGKDVIMLAPHSDRYTVPKKLRIQGTPYEFGRTLGLMANRANYPLPLRAASAAPIHQQIVDMYRRIYPQYLDTIKGVADAYGVPDDRLDMIEMEFRFFLGLYSRLLQYERFYALTDFETYGDDIPVDGCSLASYDNGRQHLVGRNFDNFSDRPHYFALAQMEGCYRVIGHAVYDLYYWVADGVNEKGLSISQASNGEEYFWQDPYPYEPAVFSSKMARIVMDTCSTVDEALRVIGSVRIWFPNQGLHWLIADASGRSVIVEFDLNRNMVALEKSGPYELATNTALQKGEDYVMQHCWRYRTAKPMLEAGVNSSDEMFNVMRAVRATSGAARTLWTSVIDLRRLTYEIRYFKEYERRYALDFSPRVWFNTKPPSSSSTVP